MANFLDSALDWLRAVFVPAPPPPTELKTIQPRILLVISNPVIEAEGGKKLTQVFGWHDPDQLVGWRDQDQLAKRGYIADLKDVSHGLLEPKVVERVEVDDWPVMKDGFRYDDTFVELFKKKRRLLDPKAQVDYAAFIQRFDVVNKVASGQIDEVWWFAPPYAGQYESTMGGAGAFDCNSPPLRKVPFCPRKFIIMGFNYERGGGEMLEAFGHRCEDILRRVYRRASPEANLFQKFCQYDRIAPGRANCGTVHCAPNSETCNQDKDHEREWDNVRFAPSNCDDWLNYPNFTGATRQVNAMEWGSGDSRQHHLWWLRHFPRAPGAMNGVSNNWWNYVADPNNVW